MALPDRIGRFRVVTELGQGAMGTVYRGRDDTLDRDVALKVMSRGIADADARARFLREARAAARLQHPNIIVIYELGEHEGSPFMALELLEGIDLQRGIDAGVKPDPRFTLPVVLQLLAGLGHAHEHGIVHRDVKPSNVFLPLGRPAKIMDFGVARLAGHNVTTTSGVVSGTPSYMSPEQIQGGDLDGRTDLFSAGLILYELVTGEKAFEADTVVATVFKILHDDVDLGMIPAGARWDRLRGVIARALARKRDERYPDARTMASDLALALQELGGTVDNTAPADQALMVRPKVPRQAAPAATATLEVPAPRRSPARRPAPPRGPARRSTAARTPLAVAGVLGAGAVGLLGFAAWLLLGPGDSPAPTPVAPASPGAPAEPVPSPVPSAPEAEAVSEKTAPTTPAPTLVATPTPTPPPAPTPAPTPTPVLTLEERLVRANALMDEGRFSLALAEARAVLREKPTHPEATAIAQDAEAAIVIEQCIDNARAALEAGDREGALAEVRRGFAINPNDARLVALFKQATQD